MSEFNIPSSSNECEEQGSELPTTSTGAETTEEQGSEQLLTSSTANQDSQGRQSPGRRGKYRQISSDVREIAIGRYNQGESITSIASSLSLPRSTISSICMRYSMTGSSVAGNLGGDHRSTFNLQQKEQICALVDENSLLTLKNLQEKIREIFNIDCSLSTIDRVLKEFHFTVKRTTTAPAPRNSEATIDKRYEYALEFRRYEETTSVENFVFVDEVGFQVVTRPKRGRSRRGSSAYVFVPAARSRNISVVAACTRQGVLYHKIQNHAFNGENFIESLIELRMACTEKGINNPLFIMDNARIHHYRRISSIIDEFSIRILYLPAFSPFLNPIENVFSVWKNEVSRACVSTETELLATISSTFASLNVEMCEGFYRKMLGYLNRSLAKEIILE